MIEIPKSPCDRDPGLSGLGITILGWGGRGALGAGDILASIFNQEGWETLAIPSFTPDRRGALVRISLRIDKKPIRKLYHIPIEEADYILILDPMIVAKEKFSFGPKKKAVILINSEKSAGDWQFGDEVTVFTFPAFNLARKFGLGTRATPFVNTIMLGVFLAKTKLAKLETLLEVIGELAPRQIAENKKAAEEAYRMEARDEKI